MKLPPKIEPQEVARLRLAVMRLARRLRQQAPEGISPSQLSALSTLERLGPLTQGELASTERVKPPTMTRIVAALEDEGLIQRKRDDADKRCSRLSLTSQGRQFVDRSRSRKTTYLMKRLDTLENDDLVVLLRSVQVLERLLEDEV